MTNVNTPFSALPPTIGSLTGSEILAIDQGGTTKRTTVQNLASGIFYSDFPATIEYVMDGGGGFALTPGLRGYLSIPFNCTAQSVTLLGDQIGSCVIDIWKCTRDAFDAGLTAPTSANSITGSAPPTISSTTHYYSANVTTWVSSFGQGDVLAFKLVSNTALTRITTSLLCTRSLITST